MGEKMKKIILAAMIPAIISACATAPDKISASYVSPLQYQNLDCDQVREEMIRVSAHVKEVAGVQKHKHDSDEVAMGVGLVLFWPALFFLAGGDKKEELARLKGEYDALDQAAIAKKCSVAEEIKTQQAATVAKK